MVGGLVGHRPDDGQICKIDLVFDEFLNVYTFIFALDTFSPDFAKQRSSRERSSLNLLLLNIEKKAERG